MIGHSMSNGWRASQASIMSVLAANAMYCGLSVLGLGALILAAPSLFEVIKWCGVCYLAWIGTCALLLPVFAGEAEGVPLRIAILGVVATVLEYPVLLGYSLLASRARDWFRDGLKARILDALAGTALLAAAGSVAHATLRNR